MDNSSGEVVVWHGVARLGGIPSEEVAEFIAAANPTVILALLDELMTLATENRELSENLEATELRALKFFHRFNAATDLTRELRIALENIDGADDVDSAKAIAYDALEPFRAYAAAKAATAAPKESGDN